MYDNTIGRYAYDRGFDPYVEPAKATAADFSEAAHALEKGEPQSRVRLRSDRQKILSVAVPVQFYKQIVGTILVAFIGAVVLLLIVRAIRRPA